MADPTHDTPSSARQADAAADSEQEQRRRARHKLIGAAVLLLGIGVLAWRMLAAEPHDLPDQKTALAIGSHPDTPQASASQEISVENSLDADEVAVSDSPAAGASAVSAAPAAAPAGPVTNLVPQSSVVVNGKVEPAIVQAQRPAPVVPPAQPPAEQPAVSPAPVVPDAPLPRVVPKKVAEEMAQKPEVRTPPAARVVTQTPPQPSAGQARRQGDVASRKDDIRGGKAASKQTPSAANQQLAAKQSAKQPATQSAAKPAAKATGQAATKPARSEPAAAGALVVQVGAYADAQRLASVRKKLSAAGLTHFTQVTRHKGKEVTRVRLGPFKTRKQAEQAAARAKALGLPAYLESSGKNK